MYKIPKDVAAFDGHYFGTHVPLAQMLPGLRKYVIRQGPKAMPLGASDYHLVATSYFDDVAAVDRALASPEGQAEAADRRILAPNEGDVVMFLIDSHEMQSDDCPDANPTGFLDHLLS